MAEYLVHGEDLTSIADAIREKTGSTEEMVFPEGFASAVRSIEIPVRGISMADSIFVAANGTAAIVPVITPANATNQNIIWKSDDETVATVVNGVVTWVNYGNCIVTATTEDGGHSAFCEVSCEALATDVMSHFKYLGPTTYSPGTYTAWCPTGLIYDETRDVYAHFMHCQNAHASAPNACEIWFNTIDPETLEHTEPVMIERTFEKLSGSMSGAGMLGTCVKNGIYYIFGHADRGYFKSADGGNTWEHLEYIVAPDSGSWGCYVLDNGRMIMGSDWGLAYCYYSDDDGATWTKSATSANFNEPAFVDFGGGKVMAICRINRDSDKNIKRPVMHISDDYGATWTDAVEMRTVGYMGNNNCNAYVHDNYCELFVGCRYHSDSPQFTDTYYEIRQYVLDLSKGPVDDFEYVNTVYSFKNGDNPQGIPTISSASTINPDDFSTPVIAIKDKSHALMMFYAPVGRYVTHNLIAVGNVPVDDFEIPKPMPTTFTASQEFHGSGNETFDICECYGNITYREGYPQVNAGEYLNLSDIKEGGYIHVKTKSTGAYNGWETPVLCHVEDMVVYSWTSGGYITSSPLPAGTTTFKRNPCTINNVHWFPTDGSVFDIYARFKNKAWWIFYCGSWLRFYTSDSGITIADGTTATGSDNMHFEPYVLGGLSSYTTFALSNHWGTGQVRLFEYDKASV